MDQSQIQFDPNQLTPADRKEVTQHITNETQRAQIHQNVHDLTATCFSKCVPGKISSGKLDKAEESCAQNCVDRWIDANITVLKYLETIRTSSQ
ncbi:Mitochondrial import inner membrane translocase subunit tim8 [Myotisia sp. PD_48]|nr:Mitochondrial import inner membrane translocase subunit tim8 [Myotisia sp. PD_48]